MLCGYGCGQEAKYQLGNGKWCCEIFSCKCPEIRKKNKLKHIGRISPTKGKHWKLSDLSRQNISMGKKGRKIGPNSEKTKKKKSIAMIGKNKGKKPSNKCIERNRIANRKLMLQGRAKYLNTIPRSEEKLKVMYENTRQRMLNGGAHLALKGVKSPSKPELKLRELAKELFPTLEHTYKILNYDVDVALVDHKIAIEYDGWYHFDTEEHKEYHKKRQQEIEQEGWKFIRYNIFQPFPTKEQVKNDINSLIEKI